MKLSFVRTFHSSFNREIVRNEELQSNQEPQSIYLYHDEYKIIRELLWILIANDKRVLKRVDFLRTQTSIPSLIQVSLIYTYLNYFTKSKSALPN